MKKDYNEMPLLSTNERLVKKYDYIKMGNYGASLYVTTKRVIKVEITDEVKSKVEIPISSIGKVESFIGKGKRSKTSGVLLTLLGLLFIVVGILIKIGIFGRAYAELGYAFIGLAALFFIIAIIILIKKGTKKLELEIYSCCEQGIADSIGINSSLDLYKGFKRKNTNKTVMELPISDEAFLMADEIGTIILDVQSGLYNNIHNIENKQA